MASLVATAAAPLLVAPIQRLIEMASDATIGAFWEKIKLIRGVEQEKERLVSTLRRISMVLEEKNHPKHALVQSWHDELSELVYDAEDVLDEFATEAELLARRKGCSLRKLVRKLRSKHDLSRQLKSIRNKLGDITSDYKELGIQMTMNINGEPRHYTPQDSNAVYQQPRQTTSGYTPFKEKLVPREQEREKLMNWLSDTVEEGLSEVKDGDDMNIVSFFSVFGMGGMGKTTLAQSVYSDSRVEKSFQAKMWVCVSNDFNITRITKDMMASVGHSGDGGYHNVENLDALQRGLEAKLNGKRILLVLDDVWDLTPDWKNILNPLRGGKRGSRVLVTTRNKKIAAEMAETEKNILHLKGLSEEDVISVLKNKAFANKNMDGGMERLCEEISKKLGGSPLAAKTVGSLLNVSFDREYWKSVATSDEIGRLQEKDEHGIVSILGLSYERLPPHLKECFAYCSVFPKDYRFQRHELVLSWMAQGLVKPGDEKQSLEWWGNRHFDDLLSLSLFEHCENDNSPWGNEDIYVMHDLIHDLAVSVSQDRCVVMKGCRLRISEKIRHLSWSVDGTYNDNLEPTSFDTLSKCQRLRTLHLRNLSIMFQLDSLLCKKLRRLRCLRLMKCRVERLPASINNLKHLRFLHLEWLGVQELPESLGDLCNLQTLSIADCLELVRLPEQVGSLTNLRRLTIQWARKLRELPGSLCRLTNLRHLDLSHTYLLEYLPEDVSKLCNLETLILTSCGRLKRLPDIIDCLTNLKILNVIGCYNLEELPESLGDAHNLQELKLESSGPRKLPGSINRLTNLSHIHADDEMLHGIAHPGGMTALQQLCTGAHPRELKHMNELRRLRLGSLHLNVTSKEEASEAELHRKTHLTSLELGFDSIYSSPPHSPEDSDLEAADRHEQFNHDEGVLEGLQPYLASIKELTISHYRGVRWPRWMMDPSTNQGFPSLEELRVSDCPMLRGLPPHLPPTLQRLCICNCPNAEWAPPSSSSSSLFNNPPSGGKPFGGHLSLSSSLESVLVEVFPEEHADDPDAQVVAQLLVCLQRLPSLTSLTIRGPNRSQWMSRCINDIASTKNTGMLLSPPGEEFLQPLTSLRYLEIESCPLLSPFPNLEATISNREPAKTAAGDDILCNNTTSAAAMGSSSSSSFSLPGCPSSSIIPSSSSSPHPQQTQLLMEELRFNEIPTQTINKFLRGMVPFKHPRRLVFWFCNELRFLGDDDCEEADKLDCHGVGIERELEEALLALAPSLAHLQFSYCRNLRRLPPKLSCLFSLKTLEISSCPNLESLPEAGLPPALQELKINYCSEELRARCRREAGADWHKISHISTLEIDRKSIFKD